MHLSTGALMSFSACAESIDDLAGLLVLGSKDSNRRKGVNRFAVDAFSLLVGRTDAANHPDFN
jgi:hypothetical protein